MGPVTDPHILHTAYIYYQTYVRRNQGKAQAREVFRSTKELRKKGILTYHVSVPRRLHGHRGYCIDLRLLYRLTEKGFCMSVLFGACTDGAAREPGGRDSEKVKSTYTYVSQQQDDHY